MTCTSPLKGFLFGTLPSGRKNLKITSAKIDHLEKDKNGNWLSCEDPFVSPYAEGVKRDSILIPCGRCTSCRLSYSRDWATRCVLETQSHDHSYFLTLTYDDNNLRYVDAIDDKTGEIYHSKTLYKADVQRFLKRVRRYASYHNMPQRVSYFCAGEYGDTTHRPHYHMILYGFAIPDLIPWSKSDLGDQYYISPLLEKLWSHGHVLIGETTFESCAYTARYIMKKQYGEEAIYKKTGQLPPYTTMSLKPAIGLRYFDDHMSDIFDKFCRGDMLNLETPKGGRKVPIPKYYISKLEEFYPSEVAKVKEARQESMVVRQSLLEAQSDKNYLAILDDYALNLDAKITALRREKI